MQVILTINSDSPEQLARFVAAVVDAGDKHVTVAAPTTRGASGEDATAYAEAYASQRVGHSIYRQLAALEKDCSPGTPEYGMRAKQILESHLGKGGEKADEKIRESLAVLFSAPGGSDSSLN
jgi:hypothetical protein